MDRLPEEVVLQIITLLDHLDVVRLQCVSSRFLTLARDSAYWKLETFNHSRTESLRRRQQLLDRQGSSLAEIRNAISALPGSDLTAFDVSQLRGSTQPRAAPDPQAEARNQRNRALANWEPGYPGESINYYEEYIQRHAPINVGWLDVPDGQTAEREVLREVTGVGSLRSTHSDAVEHVIAPMGDGSISIWDLSPRSTSTTGGGGRLMDQTKPGFLTGFTPSDMMKNHTIMTETGAVECVSIDSNTRRGYFAVQDNLHEVDLRTLQRITTKPYPFPITALSEAHPRIPLTVGTNMTIHQHDPRDNASFSNATSNRGELIGGSLHSHASLSQPGPLSIQYTPDLSSIWVAGRFTSLLNFDRRFFPRLAGTLHSGARIAALNILPYSHIPRELDLMRNPSAALLEHQAVKSAEGSTLIAAADYKGKGSLELFGLPNGSSYQNRQTASASKLLAVAPHGGRIVFSDGDGNLKWVERDGFSHVRSYNINEAIPKPLDFGDSEWRAPGLWSSTAAEMGDGHGDIVQKIVPTLSSSSSSSPMSQAQTGRVDTANSNLLLWTGDGRLGVLGFGHTDPLKGQSVVEEWHEAVEAQQGSEGTAERAKEDAARQYAARMRRALERDADEVRFVRGLGMG